MYWIDHASWIVILPFLAAALILSLGRFLPGGGAWIGVAAMLYAFMHSVVLLKGVYSGDVALPLAGLTGHFHETSRTWLEGGLWRLETGMLLDGLSVMLLFLVTLVSLLVQIYSWGYQSGQPRLSLYFAVINLFTGAMLLSVAANNFLQFFMGWEIMGLCSYLLIGFDVERPSAAAAARKAFITTKVGDLGFYLALLLIFSQLGTFNFAMIQREHVAAGLLDPALAGSIAVLLFIGAMGKSAQAPLHVWLPDAMEGPAPVSALIHAATMVAAGVYLVARTYFLFAAAPMALELVAWVGGITALVGAFSAVVASDIKRVLAYSTISQLGFIMMALGAGHPQAGLFHLTTHGFFKALLFLGAGSVVHAAHTGDIWRMGGLSRKMISTFLVFGAATLAITGCPFTSGFYSKEDILSAFYASHQTDFFVLGVVTAALTAFYMWRLFFLVFRGDPRDRAIFTQAEESPPSMVVPMVILALLSLGAGFFFKFMAPFENWVPGAAKDAAGGLTVPAISIGAFGLGTGMAYMIYLLGLPKPETLARRWQWLHGFLLRRPLDELYAWAGRRILSPTAKGLALFDDLVVDWIFGDGAAWSTLRKTPAQETTEPAAVNFFAQGFARLTQNLGEGLRLLQNGLVQFYLLIAASGLGLMLIWALRAGK